MLDDSVASVGNDGGLADALFLVGESHRDVRVGVSLFESHVIYEKRRPIKDERCTRTGLKKIARPARTARPTGFALRVNPWAL